MQAPYLGVRIEAWASEGKPVVGEVGEMVTAPLFVVLAAGRELTEELTLRLRTAIRQQVSRRHVPDDIVETVSIPMTLTGKKLEVPIKRLLQGVAADQALNPATVANPEVLDWYVEFASRFRTRYER